MAADITSLDAHEQPSDELRRQWKSYARATPEEIAQSDGIDELLEAEIADGSTPFRVAGTLSAQAVATAFADFVGNGTSGSGCSGSRNETELPCEKTIPMYCHPLLPGLIVVPGLVPPSVQKCLLDRMVHRDLSSPLHQTNLHLHYDVPYPPDGASFFSYPADDIHSTNAPSPVLFSPKDPTVHRPLSARQVLDRRLHWVTLGGQYDWTRRVYPEGQSSEASDDEEPRIPQFPADLAQLLSALFPQTRAQAAIVNFYTPGDTMMMHRDVSEETDKGLISLSIGCDALFMAAPTSEFEKEDKNGDQEAAAGQGKRARPYVLLRLRSGDAMYMTGHDRFCWHGVPKVIRGTCPEELADWPAGEHDDGRYEAWRGWMRNKRVNLNVRQMRD